MYRKRRIEAAYGRYEVYWESSDSSTLNVGFFAREVEADVAVDALNSWRERGQSACAGERLRSKFKPCLGEVVWWVSDGGTGQTDCGMVISFDYTRAVVFNTVPRCLLLGELYPTEGEARDEYERRRNAGT